MSNARFSSRRGTRWFLSLELLAGLVFSLAARDDQAVYTDSLQNGWQNWSWNSSQNFGSPAFVHSGTASLAVTITNNYITNYWGALYLHHTAFDSSPYTNLTFWINGGTAGGQQLQIAATLNGAGQPSVAVPAPSANAWQQVTVSLASLGAAGKPLPWKTSSYWERAFTRPRWPRSSNA